MNAFRHFHDLVIQIPVSANLTSYSELDFGHDKNAWMGLTQILRLKLDAQSALALRAERYADPHGVIVTPPGGVPFRVWSGSVGWDRSLSDKVQWRSELKLTQADEQVYSIRTGTTDQEILGVTSLSLAY